MAILHVDHLEANAKFVRLWNFGRNQHKKGGVRIELATNAGNKGWLSVTCEKIAGWFIALGKEEASYVSPILRPSRTKCQNQSLFS